MSTSISSQSTGAGWRVWPWMLPVLAIIGLDQFTKTLATQLLSYGEAVAVNPYLNWTLLYNRGAAFSFLSDADGWQRWFFIGVSTVVSIVIVTWMVRLPRSAAWQQLSLALILAGAIGNLLDRLFLGHVVDFIQVHYNHYYWPAFNIADSAITLGAIGMIVDAVFFSRQSRH